VAPTAIILNDVESHFSGKYSIYLNYNVCTWIGKCNYAACNFHFHIDTGGLFKVTGSHLHCRSAGLRPYCNRMNRPLIRTDA